MAKKRFEGDWRYQFMSVNGSGHVTMAPERSFHVPLIDEGTGNMTQATEDDGSAIDGHISEAGPFETIHINHPASPHLPERHLRGILVFEGFVAGVFRMVVVGERRKDPFPKANIRAKPREEKDKEGGQEDGTWIAVKP